jgi:hypothetical protein
MAPELRGQMLKPAVGRGVMSLDIGFCQDLASGREFVGMTGAEPAMIGLPSIDGEVFAFR